LETFVETSEDYYWKIRKFKIDEYRKKLKKPQQELLTKLTEENFRKRKKEKESMLRIWRKS
jgi:hypothetical protein